MVSVSFFYVCKRIIHSENSNSIFAGDDQHINELTSNEEVVKLDPKRYVGPLSAFAPFTTPNVLEHILTNKTDMPHLWWIGQIMTYLFRPNDETMRNTQELKIKLQFTHPIVGLVAFHK